jgi:hypothetical protein
MANVYIPEQKESRVLRERYFDYAKASTADVLGASLDEALYYNPTNALGRLVNQGFLEGQQGAALTKDEWAESEFFREGIEVGDEGIKTGMASLLAERHDERASFRATLNRSRGGIGLTAAQFGVGLAASVIDPINVASAFIPSVTIARGATMAAKMGRVKGNRFMTGAMDGAIGATVVEPLVIGAAYAEQDRGYGLMDSFLNVTVGAALGGAIFYGAGKISDRYKRLPQSTKDEAQHTSVGQAILDENVNVKPITDAGEARVTARQAAKAAEEAELARPKTPYDEDYEINDFLDGDKTRLLADMVEEELDANLQYIDAQIEAAALAGDANLVQKLETDKEAITIQKRRNAGEAIERPAEQDLEAEAEVEYTTKTTKPRFPSGEIDTASSPITSVSDGTNTLYISRMLEMDGHTWSWNAVDERGFEPQSKSGIPPTPVGYTKAEAIETIKQRLDEQRKEASTGGDPAAQVEEPEIKPTPLGRLEEYSEDVNTLKAQKLEQDEIMANEIDAENNILLEELTSPENLALLPKDARDSLNEIGALETKVEKYETVVEAGRACVIRGKSG